MAPVSVPVIGGDVLFASEPLNQEPPAYSGMKPLDADGDNKLSREEAAAVSGIVYLVDRIDGDHGNGDGVLDEAEWNAAFVEFEGSGGLRAIRLGGTGDLSETGEVWTYGKSLPYLPSILLYDGLVYAVRDGGILTALDAETGAVVKQGRLREALGQYYASPVAADGKLYFADMEGKASIVKAGRDWEVLSTVDLGAPVQSTPAAADGRLYIRTHEALYCFGW